MNGSTGHCHFVAGGGISWKYSSPTLRPGQPPNYDSAVLFRPSAPVGNSRIIYLHTTPFRPEEAPDTWQNRLYARNNSCICKKRSYFCDIFREIWKNLLIFAIMRTMLAKFPLKFKKIAKNTKLQRISRNLALFLKVFTVRVTVQWFIKRMKIFSFCIWIVPY